MPTYMMYQVVALVLLVGLLVFGFLVPDSMQKKKRKAELDSIVPGDKVVTQQGICGVVRTVEGELLTVACEPDGVRLQIAKWGVRNKE